MLEDTREKTKTSLIPLSPFILVITHTTFEILGKESGEGRRGRGRGEKVEGRKEEKKREREGREEGRGIN